MGILDSMKDPRFIGYALQQIGATGKPQYQAMLQNRYMQGMEQEQRQRQLGGILDNMDLSPQQRTLLSILPPEEGMGILAQQAFSQNKQIPGRDVPYSPEVLEQQMALRGRGPGMGGETEFGVSPLFFRRPDGSIGVAQLSKAGGARVAQGLPEGAEIIRPAERIGGALYDPLSARPRADVTPALERGKAAEARGSVTGKYEGEKPLLAMEAQRRVDTAAQKVTNLDEVIDKAIEQSESGWTTGFWGSMTGFVPGTPAHNLATTLETVQAIAGFQTLQEMRELSKTGGALGQVSNVEIGLLQNAIANVRQSQTKQQLQANLRRLRQQMKTSVRRLKSAYKAEFGDAPGSEAAPAVEGGEDDIDSLINQYRSR